MNTLLHTSFFTVYICQLNTRIKSEDIHIKVLIDTVNLSFMEVY